MSEIDLDDDQEESEDQELIEVHQKSRADFNRMISAVQDERDQSLQDRRFGSITGAQWEGDFGDLFDGKPKLEINKIFLDVIRIINEYRNNRITVDFVSKDGSDGDDLADTLDGLYRADEQRSVADEAYDNAFEEAVWGGFGAWRIRADYEDEYDEENEMQDVFFEPIFDADSCVFFDTDATRQDKSDALQCWVLTGISRELFLETYDDDPASWPKEIDESEFDWATPDLVYVAEHYVVEIVKEKLFIYKDVNGKEEKHRESEFENDEGLEKKLMLEQTTLVRERTIKVRRIHKYLESGAKVLEDQGYIAGSNIPIIPVFGKRWVVDGVERFMGHVRLAKDLQRVINGQYTKLMEISALSTVEKPIVATEQIRGHEQMWADDNIKNYPYLEINALTDKDGNKIAAAPAGYTRVPNVPPALAALLQISETDIKEILGNQEAGEKILPNTSGVAIDLVQKALAMQLFIYMSNMEKAIKRGGEVWLSMKQDLLVESGRKARVLSKEGKYSMVELKTPYTEEETGEVKYKHDIANAKHMVVAKAGPSSSTKKSGIVRQLTNIMQVTTDPEMQTVLVHGAIANMEGEGLADIRDFSRQKMIKMGVTKPTDEEAKKLLEDQQNQGPDADEEYLLAAAQESEADAVAKRFDNIKTIEDAKYTAAKTAEILSNMERGNMEAALQVSQEVEQKAAQLQSGNRPAAQTGENLNTGL